MTPPVRSLAVRAVWYHSVGELVPLYGLYALLFAENGLSTAQISSLLLIWSATAFLLEVPSGGWADTVSRRGLLIAGGLLSAAAFASWTVFPSYTGFAVGFVLWGASSALESGTFQALIFDDLAARSSAVDYPRIIGYATSGAQAAGLVGILAAGPLFAWGGFGLVGWVSVGVGLVQAALAILLPASPRRLSVAGGPGMLGSYLVTLRTGLAEFLHHRTVRGGVLLAAILFGFTALDEYFALIAGENGADTRIVPYLIAITYVGSFTGSVLAGRTAGVRARVLAVMLVLAAVALAAGALTGGPGVLGVLGFVAIGLGYGVIKNAVIVVDARVQEAISGKARATVSSFGGLLGELVSLAVFGAVALGSVWLTTPVLIAVLAAPVALTALVVPRWLPPRSSPPTRTVPPE